MSRTVLLQDWVTIRGTNSTLTPIVQDEAKWLDLSGLSDVTCWIDVTEVTPPGGDTTKSVTVSIETAATCDDAYFTALTPPAQFGTAAQFYQPSTTPVVLRSQQTNVTSSLMRYVRWKLTPSATGAWDITFRIRVVGTRTSAFVPPSLGNCVLWLRADMGVTLGTGASVASWKDLSGNGNDVSNSSHQPTWSPNGINNQPAVKFTQSSLQVLFSASTPSLSGSACMVAVVSPTVGSTFKNTRILGILNAGGNFAYYLGSNDGTGTQWRMIINNVWGTAGGSNAAGNYVLVANYDAPTTTGKLYQNGVNVASDAIMTSPPAFSSAFNVGSTAGDAFTNDYFNGFIAEVAFFTRSLSARELTRMHRYLGARYNITVP